MQTVQKSMEVQFEKLKKLLERQMFPACTQCYMIKDILNLLHEYITLIADLKPKR